MSYFLFFDLIKFHRNSVKITFDKFFIRKVLNHFITLILSLGSMVYVFEYVHVVHRGLNLTLFGNTTLVLLTLLLQSFSF